MAHGYKTADESILVSPSLTSLPFGKHFLKTRGRSFPSRSVRRQWTRGIFRHNTDGKLKGRTKIIRQCMPVCIKLEYGIQKLLKINRIKKNAVSSFLFLARGYKWQDIAKIKYTCRFPRLKGPTKRNFWYINGRFLGFELVTSLSPAENGHSYYKVSDNILLLSVLTNIANQNGNVMSN